MERAKRIHGHELGLWNGNLIGFTHIGFFLFLIENIAHTDPGHRFCADQPCRSDWRLPLCHVPLSRRNRLRHPVLHCLPANHCLFNSVGHSIFAAQFGPDWRSAVGAGRVSGRGKISVCRRTVAGREQTEECDAIGRTHFVGLHVHHIDSIRI